MVFNLIAWEQIHVKDLEHLPSVKRLICQAAIGARKSIANNGSRDPGFSGPGRRTFNDIGEVELAANMLPRLEQILFIWGITIDEIGGTIGERKPTDAESDRLTKYFGEV